MSERMIDFAIVTAVEIERKAVCNAFGLEDNHRRSYGNRVYWRGRLEDRVQQDVGQRFYEIVVAQSSDMAGIDVATLTTEIINLLSPRALLLVGIAGAASDGEDSDDEALGDLIIGSYAYYCERGKVIALDQVQAEPYMIPASESLWNCINSISDWNLDISVPRPDAQTTLPKILKGVIASGEKVVASEAVRDEIKSGQRKIRAIEMESYAFSKAVHQKCGEKGKHIEHLVMKAICDRANRNKDEDWQPFAAAVAAAAAKHFLLDCLANNFIPPRNRPLPAPLDDKILQLYKQIISSFENGAIIPFLGSGINLYERYPILDVQRSDYPEYPLTLEEYLSDPIDTPLSEIELVSLLTRKIIQETANQKQDQEGKNETDELIDKLVGFPCVFCHINIEKRPSVCPMRKKVVDGERFWECPLFTEQSLAVAKTNLRFLSQYFQNWVPNQLYFRNTFYGFFQNSKPNELHRFFADMADQKRADLPLIITTNYDDFLEQAFIDANLNFDVVFCNLSEDLGSKEFNFLHKISRIGNPRKETIRVIKNPKKDHKIPFESSLGETTVILKLCGSLSEESSNFIITENQHIDHLLYSEFEEKIPCDLLKYIKDRSLLFLGYSLNDYDLHILNQNWSSILFRKKQKTSWFIQKSRSKSDASREVSLERRRWKDRGVELVESTLEECLAQIEAGVGINRG